MQLLLKQRMFSWFDSYDIYDEDGNTVFQVKGRLSWGHCLEIFDSEGSHVGTVKEEVLAFFPASHYMPLAITLEKSKKNLPFSNRSLR